MLGLARRRTVTVRAITVCSLLQLTRIAFLEALDNHPEDRKVFRANK